MNTVCHLTIIGEDRKHDKYLHVATYNYHMASLLPEFSLIECYVEKRGLVPIAWMIARIWVIVLLYNNVSKLVRLLRL